MIGDKRSDRLIVIGLQVLSPLRQSLCLSCGAIAKVAEGLPPPTAAVPLLILIACNQSENLWRAVRHHVHIGQARDRNRQLWRLVVEALEDGAEAPQPSAAHVYDGNTVLSEVRTRKTSPLERATGAPLRHLRR